MPAEAAAAGVVVSSSMARKSEQNPFGSKTLLELNGYVCMGLVALR